MMLDDMVELNLPDCSLFNSSLTCELNGALNYNYYNSSYGSSMVHGLCQWTDVEGRLSVARSVYGFWSFLS